jgi:hypothetical protein
MQGIAPQTRNDIKLKNDKLNSSNNFNKAFGREKE